MISMGIEKSSKHVKTNSLALLLSCLLLFSFLLLTEPSEENFSFSLLPLILLWFVVFFLINLVLKILIHKTVLRTQKIVSTTIASTIVMAVMFSALGQLRVFDVLLLVILMSLSVFYISRTWPK
jgi:hypothetical protein